ncbi:MAG: hypoxanthine phosphoribosyltransferase [Prevotellaceae bacterium]|jgi:hypoxanthine phosphoribosyltransferase|nr:hypoxanthine phosphoribosyltransferase [Prevotellaceae bacterium]
MNQIKLHNKIFEKYIEHQDILKAVQTVAQQINHDMRDEDTPVFLSVLNGSFMFAADLMKQINFNCRLHFIKLSSYSGIASQGSVKEIIGLNTSLTGKTVILLEDVVDSGTTLEHLVAMISKMQVKQLKICTLLFKPEVCKSNIKPDYVGMHVSNDFIVGYGLDYDELGRNYPDIYKIVEPVK